MASFAIPLSGLVASSDALAVISNNLANLNTDGYKDQTLNFGDIFNNLQGSSGNGDPIQVGGGVQIENTVSNFTNGGVDATGQAANMALQGNGFFVVNNNGALSYTRDGDFSVNSAGQIVDASGGLVMGYQANAAGQVQAGSALAPITVNGTSSIAAQASTTFSTTTNLQADSASGATEASEASLTAGLAPPVRNSVMRTTVRSCLWPRLRREFLRRRFLKAITLAPRPWETISPATDAPATSGAPIWLVSPSKSASTSKATTSPGSPGNVITVISSSAATRYCLPPVLITANIVFSVFNPALRLKRRGRLLCSGDLLVELPAALGQDRGKAKSAAESRAGASGSIGGLRRGVKRLCGRHPKSRLTSG